MRIIGSPAYSNKDRNPYNYLLYSSLEKLGVEVLEPWSFSDLRTASIWHLHWPENFLYERSIIRAWVRFFWLVFKISLTKIFKVKIIWTVHNLTPHKSVSHFLKKIFYKFFPLICDGFIFLSTASKNQSNIWGVRISSSMRAVIPHGSYKSIVDPKISRQSSRKSLGIDPNKFIFLFFGQIRAYKNVPKLLMEFNQLLMPDALLCIVGSTLREQSIAPQIQSLSGKNDQVIFKDEFVQENELQQWVAASDVVVLPYKSVTNSGSALYALSCNRPVIAPKISALFEIQKNVGDNCMILYDGEFNYEHLVNTRSRISNSDLTTIDLSRFDWDLLAKETINFYCRIVTASVSNKKNAR